MARRQLKSINNDDAHTAKALKITTGWDKKVRARTEAGRNTRRSAEWITLFRIRYRAILLANVTFQPFTIFGGVQLPPLSFDCEMLHKTTIKTIPELDLSQSKCPVIIPTKNKNWNAIHLFAGLFCFFFFKKFTSSMSTLKKKSNHLNAFNSFCNKIAKKTNRKKFNLTRFGLHVKVRGWKWPSHAHVVLLYAASLCG